MTTKTSERPPMRPARARGTRRRQLETEVAAGAQCADADEDFFREEGESAATWAIRREGLRRVCEACPVLAQCRELALRYDANLCEPQSGRDDCMVRGGLTARQIATIRRSTRNSRSLAKAVLADRRTINAAVQVDQARAEINRLAVDDLTTRRVARRQRNGWTRAA